MYDEYDDLLKNDTWMLVPFQNSMNFMCYKWVYKIKRKTNVIVERYKAWLVAKGFHQ